MVRKAVFPPSPSDPEDPPSHCQRSLHRRVDEVTVRKALFDQLQRKAPGPDKLNISALWML